MQKRIFSVNLMENKLILNLTIFSLHISLVTMLIGKQSLNDMCNMKAVVVGKQLYYESSYNKKVVVIKK
jgi:hypothetical protein